MSGNKKLTRTVVALFASLLMSSVAVGTAVGPAHAVAGSSETILNA